MLKKLSVVAIVALFASQVQAGTVESFDSGAWGAGWSNTGAGTINAAAAHDGAFGVTLNGVSWTYNTSIVFSAGSTLSAWVRPTLGSSGRAYFGFGADASGADSFVTASNTTELLFQDNVGYDFVDTAATLQSFQPQWYRIEIARSTDGSSAVGKLFAADGTTLLNSLTQTGLTKNATGIALRGFGGFDVDTVTVSAVPEPETYAMMLAGLALMGTVARRRKQKSMTA